jgi:hypothetical protein
VWNARNKTDLIIEVWEKLDCESVGGPEIEAIETVVREEYGESAVDSPMIVARMLADEGAVLRHSEIMRLYLDRRSDIPYEAELRNLFDLSNLKTALRSIRNAENLRRKFASENDSEGQRRLRDLAVLTKKMVVDDAFATKQQREDLLLSEAAQWLKLWLQSPELFENWIKLRTASDDFKNRFGALDI